MHFWIDKRSQTCGFSGRHRVPASLSAGCGHQRRRRRNRSKPMVTPVHRFQSVECIGVAQQNARRSQHHRQLHNYVPNNYSGNRPAPNVRSSSAHSAELDSGVFLDIPLDGAGNTPTTSTATHHQQQQLLPFGRLKCGMWASFALATVFVAGAKVYYDHQGRGMEVLVFCALLLVFLLSVCTVMLCRSKTTRDLFAAAVTLQASRTPSTAPPTSSVPPQTNNNVHNEEIDLSEVVTLSQLENSPSPIEPPPPPYHIAILLPQQDVNVIHHASEEAPPPSYDKAVG